MGVAGLAVLAPEASATISVTRDGPPRAPSATAKGKRTSWKSGMDASNDRRGSARIRAEGFLVWFDAGHLRRAPHIARIARATARAELAAFTVDASALPFARSWEEPKSSESMTIFEKVPTISAP